MTDSLQYSFSVRTIGWPALHQSVKAQLVLLNASRRSWSEWQNKDTLALKRREKVAKPVTSKTCTGTDFLHAAKYSFPDGIIISKTEIYQPILPMQANTAWHASPEAPLYFSAAPPAQRRTASNGFTSHRRTNDGHHRSHEKESNSDQLNNWTSSKKEQPKESPFSWRWRVSHDGNINSNQWLMQLVVFETWRLNLNCYYLA